VIVDAVFAATAVVVTVNVAVVAPTATVTLTGTVADALLDASVTTKPPAGAAADNVTVPVLETPPATDVGFNVIDVSVGAVIVRLAVWELPDSVAVIVADAFAATAVVVTVNVAVVCPAATVTLAGTVAAALLDASVTTRPPAGAAADSVTVPVLDAPPATDVGFNETELSDGPVGPPVTVSVAAWLETPVLAESDDVVVVATAAVVTVNDAADAPLGTVTVAGTVAAPVLLDAKFTTTPPGPALSASVTVAVVLTPPATDALVSDSALTLGGLTISVPAVDAPESVPVIVAVTDAAT
jgi:hypothetical protein